MSGIGVIITADMIKEALKNVSKTAFSFLAECITQGVIDDMHDKLVKNHVFELRLYQAINEAYKNTCEHMGWEYDKTAVDNCICGVANTSESLYQGDWLVNFLKQVTGEGIVIEAASSGSRPKINIVDENVIHVWLNECRKAVACRSELAFYVILGGPDEKSKRVSCDVTQMNCVRRLSDSLWINWKTRLLANDLRIAMSDFETCASDDSPYAADGSEVLGSILTRDELRLLSIIVQGEGALVSWKELSERMRIGGGLHDNGRLLSAHRSSVHKAMSSSESLLREAKSTGRTLLPMNEILQAELKDQLDEFFGDVSEKHIEGYEGDGKSIQEVVKDFCSSYTRLKDVIEIEEGKGCRFKIEGNNPYMKQPYLYSDMKDVYECSAEGDWEKIKTFRDGETACFEEWDVQAWLRLYYDQTCRSFTGKISNAGDSSDDEDSGADVFGKYKMVQAYMNAYATESDFWMSEEEAEEEAVESIEARIEKEAEEEGAKEEAEGYEKEDAIKEEAVEGETDADANSAEADDIVEAGNDEADDKKTGSLASKVMLDYVEEWFCKNEDGEFVDEVGEAVNSGCVEENSVEKPIIYGRVLVLHGQPGDGKTTFCKKAVYAHCQEGWLKAASHVLYFSLNTNKSSLIYEDKKKGDKRFDLANAFCLKEKHGEYICDISQLKHALIIFDGYDELSDELGEVPGFERINIFEEVCVRARDLAKKYEANIIITSRTMCIKDDLDSFMEENLPYIASFAPMTIAQQEAMVDRMIEVDEEMAGRAKQDGDDKTASEIKTDIAELRKYQKQVLRKLRKKEQLKNLLRIPSLFRMIVTIRFDDKNNAQTFAGLYGDLFHKLMTWKQPEGGQSALEKEEQYIKKYEEIASRIFYYGSDTCPFSPNDELDDKRELIYKFLTKHAGTDTGQLGFLHRSFYQYFLARYIVSEIERIGIGTRNNKKKSAGVSPDYCFERLFKVLSARRLAGKETFMWSLISQIAEEGARRGSRRSINRIPMTSISTDHIRSVLKRLDQEKITARMVSGTASGHISCVLKESSQDKIVLTVAADIKELVKKNTAYQRKPGTGKSYVIEVDNAVFNLVSACAAAENGCLAATKEMQRIAYGGIKGGYDGFENICRLMQRGDLKSVYLDGVNLDGCDLRNASLEGAWLRGASLKGANLDGAQLEGAHLEGVHLEKARLAAANLTAAYMKKRCPDRRAAPLCQSSKGKDEGGAS